MGIPANGSDAAAPAGEERSAACRAPAPAFRSHLWETPQLVEFCSRRPGWKAWEANFGVHGQSKRGRVEVSTVGLSDRGLERDSGDSVRISSQLFPCRVASPRASVFSSLNRYQCCLRKILLYGDHEEKKSCWRLTLGTWTESFPLSCLKREW